MSTYPPPATPPPPQPGVARRSAPRRHRPRQGLYWLAVLVSVLVMIGATVAAAASYFGASSPDGRVRSYFAALARADAKSALAFGAVPDGDHRYLTAAVLQQQLRSAPISQIAIVDVDTTGDTSNVDLTYQLGRLQISDRVPMVRQNGDWRLKQSALLVGVSLAQARDRATLASTALPPDDILLFPGMVPVQFDTPNLSLAMDAGVVRFAGSDTSEMSAQVTAVGIKAVDGAVTKSLNSCVTAASPSALCPVPANNGIRSVPSSLHGTIVGTPKIKTSVATDATGTIDITGTVEVDGTYDSLDYDNLPSVQTGKVTLDFQAHAYASTPTALVWDVQS